MTWVVNSPAPTRFAAAANLPIGFDNRSANQRANNTDETINKRASAK